VALQSKILLGLLGLSVVLFVLFSIFRQPTRYEVVGVITESGDQEINYGIQFASPPQLDILRQTGAFQTKYKITEQTTQHFKITISEYSVGFVDLRWVATGIPSVGTDPRSPWESFDLGQKLFSISAILSFIGFLADVLGIFEFVRSRVRRREKAS
jgi:hypothetical protein